MTFRLEIVMSVFPEKGTFAVQQRMSALGPEADIKTLWPVHHFGWRFQQGKVVTLAAHIWVSRCENAERVVLKQPRM